MDNLNSIPFDLLHRDNVVSIALRYLSNETIVSLFDSAEMKLDESEKGKRIKCLLFKNISQERWIESGKKSEAFSQYWGFVFKKVMFCVLIFFFFFCNIIGSIGRLFVFILIILKTYHIRNSNGDCECFNHYR